MTTTNNLADLLGASGTSRSIEEDLVYIDGPFVAYVGPDKITNPWSAVEFGVRRERGLKKDRSKFDAVDPRSTAVFKPSESDEVEIKSGRAGHPRHGGSSGRLAIREDQHAKLINADGDYVLAVYEQLSDRLVYLADTVRVPARVIDDIVDEYQWSPRDAARQQSNEVRVPWTDLPYFDEERVQRRAVVLDYAS